MSKASDIINDVHDSRPPEGGSVPQPRRTTRPEAVDGRILSQSGKEDSRGASGSQHEKRTRGTAASIIREIGKAFVERRKTGKSKAVAELENELMLNADILMDAGYFNAKDLIGIVLDLEKARSSDAGVGEQTSGDQLANWLNEKDEVTQ